MTKRLLAAALLAGLAAPSRAAFNDTGAGARAPGMGNVFVAVADDVYAIYYNPAGLATMERPELAASYSRLLLGLTDSSELSSSFGGYAHPLGGSRGTVGASWQQFSLNTSLYQENAFSLSYGRPLAKDLGPGDLYGGVNLKYLQSSFGTSGEAANALNGLAATGSADPVLTGRTSMGAPDADLGLLYRLKDHYTLGASVTHVLAPNLSFIRSDAERLPLLGKVGLNYRSTLSNVGVQYESQRSPTGTQDYNVAFAAERWFPRLFVGDFGLRGALGLGTRDFKQATVGLSYRSKRFEVDYAFALPINTIAATAGTHRIGFSMRFGSLREADESVEMVLEAMRQLKGGKVPEVQLAGKGLKPSQRVLLDEYLAQAEELQAKAQYRAALEKFGQAMSVSPADAQLLKNFGRLNFVAQSVKELPAYKTDPVSAATHQGILAYLAGNEPLAIERVSHALSLKPEDANVDAFLSQLELATGLKRPALAKAKPEELEIERMLTEASAALQEARYDAAIDLSQQILQRNERSLPAWENLGTAYFALGAYADSLKAWERALPLENDAEQRKKLRRTLESIRKILSRPRPVARPAAAKVPPEEIRNFYLQGVNFYTSGQLEEAKKMFEKVLELNPEHVEAAKALRRVKEELSPR